MIPIKNDDNLDAVVKKTYEYEFSTSYNGLHLVEIIAKTNSWWQNLKSFRSFFNDDDLAVKIDDKELAKLNGKSGLFDGEAAWNGNNLKGLTKTMLLFTDFSSGSHTLKFLSDQNPVLKSIKIEKIENKEDNFTPLVNNPPQDGNRRQWITMVVNNLPLKNLFINASAKNYPKEKDDDDIKLIIDGKIIQNKTNKSHKNWFWCGKILEGKEDQYKEQLNLKKGLHYIELWADKSPVIKELKLQLVVDGVQKRIPTVDDPQWTGDFYDDPENILLARLILGEAENQPDEAKEWIGWSVINRTRANSW